MDATFEHDNDTDATQLEQDQMPNEALLHTITSTPGITPQKTRLGETYLVGFDGPDDPYNPQNWPMKKK